MTCDIGHTWDDEGTIPGVPSTPAVAWYARLPGMDVRDLSGDQVMINRLFAYMCAQRVIGVDVTRSRSNSDRIKEQGRKMFWWLFEAPDLLDGYARRTLLGEVCAESLSATSGARAEHFLITAQWMYEQMVKMTLPDSVRRSAA